MPTRSPRLAGDGEPLVQRGRAAGSTRRSGSTTCRCQPELAAWLQVYTDEHYRPEPKKRRRPQSFLPPERAAMSSDRGRRLPVSAGRGARRRSAQRRARGRRTRRSTRSRRMPTAAADREPCRPRRAPRRAGRTAGQRRSRAPLPTDGATWPALDARAPTTRASSAPASIGDVKQRRDEEALQRPGTST